MNLRRFGSRRLSFLCLAVFVGACVVAGGASEQMPKKRLLEKLGKQIFFDKSLSNPGGMACASCHDPATGFTYPNSEINKKSGTVPGAVSSRYGNRRPPTIAYAPFLAKGVPHWDNQAQAWVGGLFWDGRTPNATEQVRFPMTNPNEMNSTPARVVNGIRNGSYSELFKRVFGAQVFRKKDDEVFRFVSQALVAYEASEEVSPYTSKYDAYLEGKAQLTAQELLGLRLATGTLNGRPGGLPFKKSAHCMDCHGASTNLEKSRDLWTNSCYANLGVPRNDKSGYFTSTDAKANPMGYNKDGRNYLDQGLAGFVYGYYGWKPRVPHGPDPLRTMGAFKAPTLRNVDKRPSAGFVKAYMHNGYFKSLEDVVHFYNSRNVTDKGEVIDFTAPDPYARLKGKPLFERPEYLDPNTLINPTGMSGGVGSRQTSSSPVLDLDAMQIGNLRLSEEQEKAIVAFLKCLTDGYFKRD